MQKDYFQKKALPLQKSKQKAKYKLNIYEKRD